MGFQYDERDRLSNIPVRASLAPTGDRLSGPLKQRMESAFGADFSQVRLKQDQASESLGAPAFARGDNLHFSAGAYEPHSRQGQHVLAHELTHVVQQRQGRVSTGGQTAINRDQGLESEADRVADRVADGGFANLGSVGAGSTAAIDAPVQMYPGGNRGRGRRPGPPQRRPRGRRRGRRQPMDFDAPLEEQFEQNVVRMPGKKGKLSMDNALTETGDLFDMVADGMDSVTALDAINPEGLDALGEPIRVGDSTEPTTGALTMLSSGKGIIDDSFELASLAQAKKRPNTSAASKHNIKEQQQDAIWSLTGNVTSLGAGTEQSFLGDSTAFAENIPGLDVIANTEGMLSDGRDAIKAIKMAHKLRPGSLAGQAVQGNLDRRSGGGVKDDYEAARNQYKVGGKWDETNLEQRDQWEAEKANNPQFKNYAKAKKLEHIRKRTRRANVGKAIHSSVGAAGSTADLVGTFTAAGDGGITKMAGKMLKVGAAGASKVGQGIERGVHLGGLNKARDVMGVDGGEKKNYFTRDLEGQREGLAKNVKQQHEAGGIGDGESKTLEGMLRSRPERDAEQLAHLANDPDLNTQMAARTMLSEMGIDPKTAESSALNKFKKKINPRSMQAERQTREWFGDEDAIGEMAQRRMQQFWQG